MYTLTSTIDAKPKAPLIIKRSKPDSPFQKSKRIQLDYERALRSLSREVNKLIRGYDPKDVISAEALKRALNKYSEIISPWALTVVNKVLREVDKQDINAWKVHSQRMSIAMRREILNAPTGEAFQKLMKENVDLITSIPREAAERVHNLVIENLATSKRATEITEEILKTNKITENRARLIARTEVARASSLLTQARATYVGGDSYIWRSSKDLTVRQSHREMEGKIIRWDTPPTLSDGTVTHAGMIYNCRCWTEPVVPEGDFN